MSKAKEVFVRIGITDVVLPKTKEEGLSSYARIYDEEGELITDTETYLVGYEDEEGEECDEDGNYLNQ